VFPFSMFAMSKGKTLAWTLFCVGLTIICAYANMSYVTLAPLSWAVMLGAIAAYKFIRDHGIISNARVYRGHTPVQLPPLAMTSKGSTRLFVPPPLDRR